MFSLLVLVSPGYSVLGPCLLLQSSQMNNGLCVPWGVKLDHVTLPSVPLWSTEYAVVRLLQYYMYMLLVAA